MRSFLIALLSVKLLAAATYQEKAVAAVLMAEAWNQGENGMSAVMEVIHQRSLERGLALYRVIREPKAFSCLNTTTLDNLIAKFEKQSDFATALKLAALPADKLLKQTNRANHYTNKREKPKWAQGLRPVAVIKDHAFYRITN